MQKACNESSMSDHKALVCHSTTTLKVANITGFALLWLQVLERGISQTSEAPAIKVCMTACGEFDLGFWKLCRCDRLASATSKDQHAYLVGDQSADRNSKHNSSVWYVPLLHAL